MDFYSDSNDTSEAITNQLLAKLEMSGLDVKYMSAYAFVQINLDVKYMSSYAFIQIHLDVKCMSAYACIQIIFVCLLFIIYVTCDLICTFRFISVVSF